MSSDGSLPIEIEMRGERVRKTYRDVNAGPGVAAEKFHRELAAYHHFERLRVPFVPGLLDFDERALWLEIERVDGDRTLAEWVESAPVNGYEPVIVQLITADRFFYDNNINYLQATATDILVGNHYRLYFIDFEYTFLNERFQQILYERLFEPRMMNLVNTLSRDAFLATLAARKKEFHKFVPRKVHNAILGRLGLLRANRLVAR